MTLRLLMAVTAVCFLASSASASLTGIINFTGTATTDTTDVTTATAITAVANSAVIAPATGDFAGTEGDGVSWTVPIDLTTLGPVSYTPLWITDNTSGLGVFEFDLTAVTSITPTTIAGQDFLILTGRGDLFKDGAEQTPGNFALTLQDSTGGTSNQFEFSFSANNNTVPEPATVVVWSLLSLVGVFVVRRVNR